MFVADIKRIDDFGFVCLGIWATTCANMDSVLILK